MTNSAPATETPKSKYTFLFKQYTLEAEQFLNSLNWTPEHEAESFNKVIEYINALQDKKFEYKIRAMALKAKAMRTI